MWIPSATFIIYNALIIYLSKDDSLGRNLRIDDFIGWTQDLGYTIS